MTRFADVVGRYVYLTVQGTEYRVYYEESGQGTPLICQHTAGTDSRQWRHLLEDPELTANHRVIAADLPFHGKSLPPHSFRWWEENYKLTLRFFMDFHLELAKALGAEQPIYIGSSMGGHLAAELALHHPESYRAVIGLEAAMNSGGDQPLLHYYFHPQISNEFKTATMYGLCSPLSPEEDRRETTWVYSQGAPSTFVGDLAFYVSEHDMTETAKDVDTSQVQVHILCGEYDWSATPAMSKELADAIDGATFTEMKGLGHFPMSEDYASFRVYLMQTLAAIAASSNAPVAA